MPRRFMFVSPRFGCLITSLFLVLFTAPPSVAEPITVCAMSGSTPGFQAIRFDLPEGTSFLSIEPHSTRPARVSDDANWHLAQGLVVVDADTFELEAARVEAYGTAPRSAVIRSAGIDERAELVGPDGPFYHQASRPVPGLAAGSYYAVAFGSDGGDALPNEWWSFDLRIGGRHSCVSSGIGRVFDIDQSEFSGGSQLYAPGVGTAEGISHSFNEPAETDLVVGLMDVAVQGPGEAVMDFATPLAAGVVDDEIVPFVSRAGDHVFGARYAGAFPQILIAGVAVAF